MDSGESREDVNRQSQLVLDLIALLDVYREEIATAWAHAICQTIPHTRYGQYPVHQISAYNCVGLEFFQEYLVHPDALPMQSDLANREPMTSLVQAGVTISELLQAAWLFPNIILPYLSRRFPTPEQLQEAMARLDICVRALLLRMAETYAAETNRLIQDQYQRTQLVLEMTRQASRSLELDQVLRQVARGIASAVGARHCLVHLVNEEEDATTLWVATDQFPGPALERLQRWLNRPIPLSEGLFPRLLAEAKRPLACRDVEADPGAIGEAGRALGARSILAVPCILDGRLLAAAIVLPRK